MDHKGWDPIQCAGTSGRCEGDRSPGARRKVPLGGHCSLVSQVFPIIVGHGSGWDKDRWAQFFPTTIPCPRKCPTSSDFPRTLKNAATAAKIGRASCRERV